MNTILRRAPKCAPKWFGLGAISWVYFLGGLVLSRTRCISRRRFITVDSQTKIALRASAIPLFRKLVQLSTYEQDTIHRSSIVSNS